MPAASDTSGTLVLHTGGRDTSGTLVLHTGGRDASGTPVLHEEGGSGRAGRPHMGLEACGGGGCPADRKRPRRASSTKRAGPSQSAGARRAFTIVELMAVVVVIAILAGIVIGGVQVAQRKAARNRAIADLERLATAIENYRGAKGFCPATKPTDTGFDNNLVYALVYGGGPGQKAFLELRGQELEPRVNDLGDITALKKAQIVDPWGRPWRYKRLGQMAPRDHTGKFRVEGAWDPRSIDTGSEAGSERYEEQNADSYDLYSVGPDGLFGTSDDVTNWAMRL